MEMDRIRLEAGLYEIYKRVTFASDFFEEIMIIEHNLIALALVWLTRISEWKEIKVKKSLLRYNG